ncbi:MAG: hypothetical protein ACRCYD_09020, partial [Plesiomonas sp.]
AGIYFVANKTPKGALKQLFNGAGLADLHGYAIYKPRFVQPQKISFFIKELKEYVATLKLDV